MMVIIDGIKKLERKYLICVGIGFDLQGGNLDIILDILL